MKIVFMVFSLLSFLVINQMAVAAENEDETHLSTVKISQITAASEGRQKITDQQKRILDGAEEDHKKNKELMKAAEQDQAKRAEILKNAEEYHKKSVELQDRFSKILDRWEEQQDEYQKYLDSLPTSDKRTKH